MHPVHVLELMLKESVTEPEKHNGRGHPVGRVVVATETMPDDDVGASLCRFYEHGDLPMIELSVGRHIDHIVAPTMLNPRPDRLPRPLILAMAHQLNPIVALTVGLTARGRVINGAIVHNQDQPIKVRSTHDGEKFLERIEGHQIAPSILEQANESGIDVVSVPIHKSEEVMPHLEGMDLDLIVFGGTRIIRGEILDYPADGVINSHPGLLPDCRGSASPAWSVFHDIPIGSSTHFCDNGIDTGDLLMRREFPVLRGMTYEDLCYHTLVLAGVLMKEALLAYEQGVWDEIRRPQGEAYHPTFRNAPEEILEVVRQKLRDQTYAHYSD